MNTPALSPQDEIYLFQGPTKRDIKWAMISSVAWPFVICWGASFVHRWFVDSPLGPWGAIFPAIVVVVGLIYLFNRIAAISSGETIRHFQMGAGMAICYAGFALAFLLYLLDSGALSMGQQLLARTAMMIAGATGLAGYALFQFGYQKDRFGRLIWQS